jgi:hypothetical protein
VIIEDDRGNKWVVQAGDPARKLITRLERSNYGWVVLPALALATGSLPETVKLPPTELAAFRMADCLKSLED